MNKPPDAQQRARALDPSRSFLVQAPAGSGKTELLIQRYMALLARVEEAEAVVAITFTRKAAGEMRNRIVEALEGAACARPVTEEHEMQTRELALAVLARDRDRDWRLRQMPSRLRIQTIDSLCAAIAHGMPALSGFGGGVEVLESPEDLYQAAAHAAVLLLSSESVRESEAVARLLRHLDNDIGKVEALMAAMLHQRDQWLRHLGSGVDTSGVREALNETLNRIVCRCLQRLRAAVPKTMAGEVVELAAFAAAQPVNFERPIRNCMRLSSLPGDAAANRELWDGVADLLLTSNDEWRKPRGVNASLGFAATSAERKRLQKLLAELESHVALLAGLQQLRKLPPSRIDDRQWPIIEALFCLLPRAVAELKRLFAEHAQVDFIEVAHAASRALGPKDMPTELALALGCRIEHLLVDEYQDTSVTQQELLEKLTAGWDTGDGRTLFLVGDPMQSIYRFRQAEVGLFLSAAETGRIGNIDLQLLKLKANFRSCREIVDWANQTFPQVFPAEDDIAGSAVKYAPSEPVKKAAGAPVTIHPFLGTADDVQGAEAERVVALIEAARERDPKGTIAVLVRSRAHLAAIVPKLRERAEQDSRLRFRAVEIDALARRQVILDLSSLARALLHLGDRIAWLSVLRAPWCGLSLQDLYELCADDKHACVWDLLRTRLSQLSPDGALRAAHLRERFATALKNRGRQPLAQAVRGLWLVLGGPACCSGAERKDAGTFFDVLEELETGGEVTWARLQSAIEKLFANPDPGADGTLQLLTIHKAKGLQFDTVILPGLGRRPRREDVRLLLWLERAAPEGEPELLLAPIKQKGLEDDRLYSFIQRAERARGAEESKRLLYVGATRAIRELHLLGNAVVNGKGELRADSNSLLHHLWPVVSADFQQAIPQAPVVQIAAAAETAAPVRKRLPSSWAPPDYPEPLRHAQDASGAEPRISFDWAGDTVRHIGTVTHALLHKIAREGVHRFNGESMAAYAAAIRTSLLQQGVTTAELESAALRVEAALRNTMADPRGRWVLADHAEGRSEYALTGLVDGQPRRFRLDRTFVDEDGVRWIIDFKTGEREGGGREQFADEEVKRYRDQLESYARAVAKMDSRRIRLGLYFPMLGAWREWEIMEK